MQDFVHDTTQCKKVAFVGINALLYRLRWHVKRRAYTHAVNQSFLALDSKSKICDFEGVT